MGKKQSSKQNKNTNEMKTQITGILAILVGALGVHKFIQGKYIQGTLYLLFFWTGIPALLATLEGAHLLAGDPEPGNINEKDFETEQETEDIEAEEIEEIEEIEAESEPESAE